MSAVWKAAAGAWLIDDRTVHLADPLPDTRVLVGLVLSDYSWRFLAGTMRDGADVNWLVPEVLRGAAITHRVVDEIADAVAEQIFGQPRWTVRRLWTEALGVWRELDSELGARGVDVLTLAPDRATNIIYGQLRRSHAHKEDTLRTWLARLDEIPARALTTAAGEQEAADNFFAAAGALAAMCGAPPGMTRPSGVDSELTIT